MYVGPRVPSRLFRILGYFELKIIFLEFVFQSFPIGYFELPIFRTILRCPCDFEITGFPRNQETLDAAAFFFQE